MRLKDHWAFRVVAATLLPLVPALSMPSLAAPHSAVLSGSVVLADQAAPVANAKVHVADTANDVFVSSPLTGTDGAFSVEGLAPGTYEIAVEMNGGLYLVEPAVELTAGDQRTLHLAVRNNPAVAQSAALKQGRAGVFGNPFMAAMLVLGSAVGLGVLIESATDDNDAVASPFE